jgi:hypothetical protein
MYRIRAISLLEHLILQSPCYGTFYVLFSGAYELGNPENSHMLVAFLLTSLDNLWSVPGTPSGTRIV